LLQLGKAKELLASPRLGEMIAFVLGPGRKSYKR
jgi:hypothetical protein